LPFAFLDERPPPVPYVEPRHPPNVLVAGAVYLLAALVRTCAFNAAVFATVAALVLLVNLAA
jgi:hypothetical protein